jgi:hypothetical protein
MVYAIASVQTVQSPIGKIHNLKLFMGRLLAAHVRELRARGAERESAG